jgi:hypothetical protein
MAITSAQFTDLDALIENFKDNDIPYFTITDYKGFILKRNEKESDLEQAAEIVRAYFKTIDKGSQAIYSVMQYEDVPTGGFKKASEPATFSTYRQPRANYAQEGEGSTTGRTSYFYESQRMLLDEVKELRREVSDLRLSAINGDDDDDIKDQAEPVNYLGAILGNPAIMQVLTNLLTNITANIATPHVQQMATPRPVAMAGIPPDAEAVLNILFSKGVTIRDLELLAAKPQDEINFLLSMLRK